MKLDDYLTANGLSAAEFAERMGVHRGTVSRWIKSPTPGKPRFRPSWEELAKIAAITHGAVTANDFVDDDDVDGGNGARMPNPSAGVSDSDQREADVPHAV